jgi:putative membrane protein
MWSGNMMGWGSGWGGAALFGWMHLLWWGVVVGVVVLLARALLRGRRGGNGGSGDRALEILDERYARGEIDKSEFDNRRRDLQ